MRARRLGVPGRGCLGALARASGLGSTRAPGRAPEGSGWAWAAARGATVAGEPERGWGADGPSRRCGRRRLVPAGFALGLEPVRVKQGGVWPGLLGAAACPHAAA